MIKLYTDCNKRLSFLGQFGRNCLLTVRSRDQHGPRGETSGRKPIGVSQNWYHGVMNVITPCGVVSSCSCVEERFRSGSGYCLDRDGPREVGDRMEGSPAVRQEGGLQRHTKCVQMTLHNAIFLTLLNPK